MCAEPIRTIAEVRALSTAEMDGGHPVELVGTVLARTYSRAIILKDETGSFIIEDCQKIAAVPGDVVRVRGVTFVDHTHGIRQESIHQAEVNVLRHGVEPQPQTASISEILGGKVNFLPVRASAVVVDAFSDEMDPGWNCMIVRVNGQLLYVAVPNDGDLRERLATLIDAEVTLTGVVFPHYAAQRMFIGPHLELATSRDIWIDKTAPEDPFAVPRLENIDHASVAEIAALRRRVVEGLVIAVWNGNRFLVREVSGRVVRVELSAHGNLPKVGESVRAVGFPEADVFRINLSAGVWRPMTSSGFAGLEPENVTADAILFSPRGERQVKPEYHGRLVRMEGIVRTVQRDGNCYRVGLESGRSIVVLVADSCPAVLEKLDVGYMVGVDGVCVMEVENRRSGTHFPKIETLQVILRSAEDVRILSRPPWWTPARLLTVILALFGALIAIVIWNRILNRLVERRSRELFRETTARAGADLRVDERTRLAVELHDSISQNLTGASFQIDAAESLLADDPARAAKCLEDARVVLGSCRRELRDCISDLRDRTLEERDTAEAIRRSLAGRTGDAQIVVDFDVPRAKLTDNTFHAVIRIVRELVVNAVRHGRATSISVRGGLVDGRLEMMVRDDGVGFDPMKRVGASEGHFGLVGIEERLRHLGGTLAIHSERGKGTEARVRI